MPSTLHLNTGYIVVSIIAIAFMILYPLVLALIAHQKLHVSWRYFGYGALIFFLFQMISRVPIITAIQTIIAPQLKASTTLLYTWLCVLALTAGIFEEVGRYTGYRWLMGKEEKTWSKAVMYGLGHGGLESMVFVAGLALLQLVNLIALASIGLDALPAAQRTQVAQTFVAINAQPAWLALAGAWERLWTLPMQVAFSVIVLQVFRRGNISWLWLAILAHSIVDFTSVILAQILGTNQIGSLVLIEVVIAAFGIIAIWVIWALRDEPVSVTTPEFQPEPIS